MKTGKKMMSSIVLYSTLSLAVCIAAPTVASAFDIATNPGVLVNDDPYCEEPDCVYTDTDVLTVHSDIQLDKVLIDETNNPELCCAPSEDPDFGACAGSGCIDPVFIGADTKGQLVTKFSILDVLSLLVQSPNTFYTIMLTVTDADSGNYLEATDTIYLREINEPPTDPIGPVGPGVNPPGGTPGGN